MNEQQIPTSEVLNHAADLIQERGWAVGVYDEGSGVCLESAIALASGQSGRGDSWQFANLCPAGAAVRRYLDMRVVKPGDQVISGPDSLWHWNDHAAGADEVVEVLRAVAVIEAARESADQPAGASS